MSGAIAPSCTESIVIHDNEVTEARKVTEINSRPPHIWKLYKRLASQNARASFQTPLTTQLFFRASRVAVAAAQRADGMYSLHSEPRAWHGVFFWRRPPQAVIPAKAGIQRRTKRHWIPAFAGMTVLIDSGPRFSGARALRNDSFLLTYPPVFLKEFRPLAGMNGRNPR
ncbi:hypothetical protein [Viridibacterium curvum]|uniref:hypothetical protein n=1 Tax=Viridibacterium curvum TaxID=1101404 RepID=UPI0031F0D490